MIDKCCTYVDKQSDGLLGRELNARLARDIRIQTPFYGPPVLFAETSADFRVGITFTKGGGGEHDRLASLKPGKSVRGFRKPVVNPVRNAAVPAARTARF